MKVKEIAEKTGASMLTGNGGGARDVRFAFSSDLMSDVLTRDYEDAVLITGLSNLQAIRTAEMSDIGVVIIARNKVVGQEMVSLAERNEIVLLKSPFSLFRISGLLYEAGLKPLF